MELQVLDFPLKILKMLGLDPRDDSRFAKLKSSAVISALSVLTVTALMELYCTEWKIALIVPVVEGFMAAMEVRKVQFD